MGVNTGEQGWHRALSLESHMPVPASPPCSPSLWLPALCNAQCNAQSNSRGAGGRVPPQRVGASGIQASSAAAPDLARLPPIPPARLHTCAWVHLHQRRGSEYDLAGEICDLASGGQVLLGPKTFSRCAGSALHCSARPRLKWRPRTCSQHVAWVHEHRRARMRARRWNTSASSDATLHGGNDPLIRHVSSRKGDSFPSFQHPSWLSPRQTPQIGGGRMGSGSRGPLRSSSLPVWSAHALPSSADPSVHGGAGTRSSGPNAPCDPSPPSITKRGNKPLGVAAQHAGGAQQQGRPGGASRARSAGQLAPLAGGESVEGGWDAVGRGGPQPIGEGTVQSQLPGSPQGERRGVMWWACGGVWASWRALRRRAPRAAQPAPTR